MSSPQILERVLLAGAASPKAPGPPIPTLRDLVLAQLDAAHALLSGDPQGPHHGVHHARKSVRRVRAALALAKGSLGPAADRMDSELRRWCRGLSHLRDAQALVEALQRFDDTDFATPADKQLAIVHATQRRDGILLRALARDPGFTARRRRLLRVRAVLADLPWHQVGRDDAQAMLERAEHRAQKARERAKRHPDRDLDWHRLRRRLRRLRQMQTVAEAAFGIHAIAAERHDADAEALGLAQDDGLLLRACRTPGTFPPAIRRAVRARAGVRVLHARR